MRSILTQPKAKFAALAPTEQSWRHFDRPHFSHRTKPAGSRTLPVGRAKYYHERLKDRPTHWRISASAGHRQRPILIVAIQIGQR